ncbi:calcium-activated chloride channel regulator 1-like [Watersipora subatra]|uniref:calcium-activated chloride channel regulator 1-like n=1 Tax=Watersipora subatra TaxID=2589382 RepID=UPI00355B62BA
MATSSNIGNDRQDINLSPDGGYTDLLIAIDDKVSEDLAIIDKLQAYFSEASKVLLTATNNRLYFKNFTVVVPESWTYNSTWLQYCKYKPAKDETVKRARVVVAEANLAYGDEPYTLQPGGCGQEGDFIHLTPDYLTKKPTSDKKYKPRKRIVKEFGKLKWGLFDENVSVNDTKTSKFYLKEGSLIPQGCVEDVFFGFQDLSDCDLSFLPPPPPCDFVVSSVQGSASLLAFEYEDSVKGFCTDNETEAIHNVLASNLQNANCQGRSAWNVMSELNDFAENYQISRNSTDLPDPQFRIVRTQPVSTLTTTIPTSTRARTTTSATTRTTTTSATTTETSKITAESTVSPATVITSTSTVLSTTTVSTATASSTVTSSSGYITGEVAQCSQDIVCICVDISPSMLIGNRITTMYEAVQLYILNTLRNGTAVGIVSFYDSVTLNADMTEITSDTVRESLKASVPIVTLDGTNVAAGINECQRILTQYTGGDISNTRILLHSDGAVNIKDSISKIISEGVTLDTVLFGQGGYLTNQAQKTGGKEYLASDTRGQVGLLAFYEETASRSCQTESIAALINNDAIVIPFGEVTYAGRVYFDVTIGLNTKMVFKYDSKVEIDIVTDLIVTVSENTNLQTTIVVIEGQLVSYKATKNMPNF